MPRCGTITVEPRPTLGANDLNLTCSIDAPQQVRPDSVITVTYTLTNNGESAGSAVVEFTANGQAFGEDQRSVSPGQQVTGQTTLRPSEVGVTDRELTVATEITNVTVQASGPAEMQSPGMERLRYATQEGAREAADKLGLGGTHSHNSNGGRIYMPGENHQKLNRALRERGLPPTPVPGDSGGSTGYMTAETNGSLLSRLTASLSSPQPSNSRQQPCGCDEPQAGRPQQ